MAYDATKDEVIWEGGFDAVRVSVCKYNGGPAKVQLSRVYVTKDGEEKVGRIGRLTMSEFERLTALKEVVLEAGKK